MKLVRSLLVGLFSIAMLEAFVLPDNALGQRRVQLVACKGPNGRVIVSRRCRGNEVRVTVADLFRGEPGPQGPAGPTGPQGPQGDPGKSPAFAYAGSTDFDVLDDTNRFFPIDAKGSPGELTSAAVEPDSPLVNTACSRVAYRVVLDTPASDDGFVIFRLIRIEPYGNGIPDGASIICSIQGGSKVCAGETLLSSPVRAGDKLAVTLQHPGALTDYSASWNVECIDHKIS